MSFYYLSEWVIHTIDRIRRAFFWKGTKKIHGGVFLINWQQFALLKIKEVWEFAISEPSILLFFLSGGGDSFMIHTLRVWFLSFIITIEEGLMIGIILFLGISPLFGEEFSRLPRLLFLAPKLKWEKVA